MVYVVLPSAALHSIHDPSPISKAIREKTAAAGPEPAVHHPVRCIVALTAGRGMQRIAAIMT
jgi:hypothetical protein